MRFYAVIRPPVLFPARRRGFGASPSPAMQALASAIITQENAPAALNNPGALMYASQATATGVPGQLAQFPTYQDGLNALYNQLGLYAAGTCGACHGQPLTISQMTQVYAPGNIPGNDPVTYANNLAAALGVSPDTPLASLDSVAGGTLDASGADGSGDFLSSLGISLPTSIDPTTLAIAGLVFAGVVALAISKK